MFTTLLSDVNHLAVNNDDDLSFMNMSADLYS